MKGKIDPSLPGPENMARDLALLNEGEPAFRLYAWSGPWVSLGQFQRPQKALLHPERQPFVMRPTGGKGVLHGHDITLGMACSLARLGLGPSEARSVSKVYNRLIRPVVAALNDAGAEAALGEDTAFVKSAGHTADCFAHIAPLDVVHPATGMKVMGTALRLTQEAVLVQASIPVREPLVDPAEVFADPHQAAWTPGLDPEALKRALERRFQEFLTSE